MNRIAWTKRNSALLQALTHNVRFLSTEQIARLWWKETSAGQRTAERYLSRLQQAGYVERKTIVAYAELPLPAPLFCWRSPDPRPDFNALAYQCEKRWTGALRATSVWTATRRAADHFGGFGGGILKPNQVTHDLHIGTIFTRLFRNVPELVEGWIPEECLMHLGERVPDAIIYDDESMPLFAVDFGGFGCRIRLESLHRVCARWQLPYSVW